MKQMLFLNSLGFSIIQWMLTIWSLVPLPFLNPTWTSGSSQFTYYWSIAWRILSITLLAYEMRCNCTVVGTFFSIAFLWDGMKTDLFQFCGHCWVFQICWHIECSTFTASSFRVSNSSTGIPSPPLDLFAVMLPKAHLTSDSRISGSSAFSKSSLYVWKFLDHVLLKPNLKDFENYFPSMWDECNCAVVWAFFGIAFLWNWNENWAFPVPWPLLSFPNLLTFWMQHFTPSSFRIWNSWNHLH